MEVNWDKRERNFTRENVAGKGEEGEKEWDWKTRWRKKWRDMENSHAIKKQENQMSTACSQAFCKYKKDYTVADDIREPLISVENENARAKNIDSVK